MKAVLMTAHMAGSQRKVNFHFWVDALTEMGVDVDFITVGFSMMTQFKSNARQFVPPYNQWEQVRPHLRKYVWRPLFHPFSLGNTLLDSLTSPLLAQYPSLMPENMRKGISDADFFIIENGAGLLLLPKLKAMCPKAKFIYSVCDRIETLGYHPLIVNAEKDNLALFDLVRVPSEAMKQDYDDRYNVQLIPHGLDKAVFDKDWTNPYKQPKNIVGVGDMLFDADTVRLLSKEFPDWTIHLFGKKARLDDPLPNVIAYGEKPFEFIVPYIKFADIGLAPYRNAPNADYLSQSSLKMNQYSYCRLPILAPFFAAAGRDHVCGYDPEDKASRLKAMQDAINFDTKTIDTSKIINVEQSLTMMLDKSNITVPEKP